MMLKDQECQDCGTAIGQAHLEWCHAEMLRKVQQAAWQEGYGAGVIDERTAQVMEYPAAPARCNPYDFLKEMWVEPNV